jgi:hypothetical protein
MNARIDVEIINCGSPRHRDDVAWLRARGLEVPHACSSSHSHDTASSWKWCRILACGGELRYGFAVELSSSRALPGTFIGRIERLGRGLHADQPDIGRAVAEVANRLPRLQRLDVEIFDEDGERREALVENLLMAGFRRAEQQRNYRWTPVLPLRSSHEELVANIGSRARRAVRRFQSSGIARIAPIEDPRYVPRMQAIYAATFDRTGASPPKLDFTSIQLDARHEGESLLAGVFWATRSAPDDLVALVWGRLHGDYASYDVGASERADDLGNLPLGYPLMVALADWARSHGATWLDMGGIVPRERADRPELQGIGDFKRTFTDDEREVGVQLMLEPNRMLASVVKAIRWARDLVQLRAR